MLAYNGHVVGATTSRPQQVHQEGLLASQKLRYRSTTKGVHEPLKQNPETYYQGTKSNLRLQHQRKALPTYFQSYQGGT